MMSISYWKHSAMPCSFAFFILVLIDCAFTASTTPGSVVGHVRSARPGDQCNWKRDVVLLVVDNSNTDYLQCHRQTANGTLGTWNKIACNIREQFSYSRQKCLSENSELSTVTPTQQLTSSSTDAAKWTEEMTTTRRSNTAGTSPQPRLKVTPARNGGQGRHHTSTELVTIKKSKLTTSAPTTSPSITSASRRRVIPVTTVPFPKRRITAKGNGSMKSGVLAPTVLLVTTPPPVQLGALGLPCGLDSQCLQANSICTNGICDCAIGYDLKSRMDSNYCAPHPTTPPWTTPTIAQRPMVQGVLSPRAPHFPGPLQPSPVLAPRIGEPCVDGQCHNPGAECYRGICQCPIGRIIKEDTCVIIGPGPGEHCQENSIPCQFGSTCVNGKCECPNGEYIRDGICVPDTRARPGQPCNTQPGSECSLDSYCSPETGVCTCPDGLVVVNWTCSVLVVGKGDPCQSPPQTCVDGMKCVNNICQRPNDNTDTASDTGHGCPMGWIQLHVDNKKYCAPAMLKLGDSCLSPLQTCTGGSICQQGQCVCPQDFTSVQNFCLPLPPTPSQRRALGTACADSVQCVWAGGVCQIGHCVCPPGTNAIQGACQIPDQPYSVAAGGYCTAINQCAPGLACIYGVCVCMPGYDCERVSVQPSPPGATCAFSRHCTGKSSCENGWCICPDPHMIIENGDCVLKTSRHQPGNTTIGPVHFYKQTALGSGQAEKTSDSAGQPPAPLLPGLIPNGLTINDNKAKKEQ